MEGDSPSAMDSPSKPQNSTKPNCERNAPGVLNDWQGTFGGKTCQYMWFSYPLNPILLYIHDMFFAYLQSFLLRTCFDTHFWDLFPPGSRWMPCGHRLRVWWTWNCVQPMWFSFRSGELGGSFQLMKITSKKFDTHSGYSPKFETFGDYMFE